MQLTGSKYRVMRSVLSSFWLFLDFSPVIQHPSADLINPPARNTFTSIIMVESYSYSTYYALGTALSMNVPVYVVCMYVYILT